MLKKSRLRNKVSVFIASFLIPALLFTYLFSGLAFASTSSKKLTSFSDVPAGSWYEVYIQKLVARGLIEGYSSKKFGPMDNILVSQAITVVVRALGYQNLKYYSGFVEKAENLGLIMPGEFTEKDYSRPITRGEMARLVVRALNETYPDTETLNKYSRLISDYSTVPDDLKDYVLKCYYKGIATGGSHGEFSSSEPTTRGAASIIILRIVDRTMRDLPVLSVKDTTITPEQKALLDSYSVDKGISGYGHNFYCDNAGIVKELGESTVEYIFNQAKGYMDCVNNQDYTTAGDSYLKDVMQYRVPDDIKVMSKFLSAMKNSKLVIRGTFISDKSLVYGNASGDAVVRGTLRYIVTSCTDSQKICGVQLNKWVEEDAEVDMMRYGSGFYIRKLTTLSSSPRYINQ